MVRASFWTIGLIGAALLLGSGSSALATTSAVFDSADGFWYQPVLVPTGITWTAAQSGAEAAGGYLASPVNAAENNFAFSLVDSDPYWTGLSEHEDILGPWLGAFSSTDTNGANADWQWVNGAAFSFAPWGPNQPDGFPGNLPNQAVDYYAFANIGSTWGDTPQEGVSGFSLPQGYVIQFNTDPNGPGVVPLPKAAWTGLAMLAGLGALGLVKSRRGASAA
jgi:hypothetical protein